MKFVIILPANKMIPPKIKISAAAPSIIWPRPFCIIIDAYPGLDNIKPMLNKIGSPSVMMFDKTCCFVKIILFTGFLA